MKKWIVVIVRKVGHKVELLAHLNYLTMVGFGGPYSYAALVLLIVVVVNAMVGEE